ncbi:40S ribosomal S10-like protein, putative [Medicago truncatula]|uniref:40S ribosomal S10-like protein, putative n=1 Tax=Medicago truncatula TaxID=3880 RepID=A0A072TI99_MEDTR|nr:40S ribosomal S10-like protein, putative [Medicago truncatula]
MTDLFSFCIRFNRGNPQLFKVWYINVMLKALKDQLNEINQGLNPGDTWNVEYVWYERPTFDEGRITFSWPELTNDDDVRSMFSNFYQHIMFPWIDMLVTLLRSPEDILKSLIPLEPEEND